MASHRHEWVLDLYLAGEMAKIECRICQEMHEAKGYIPKVVHTRYGHWGNGHVPVFRTSVFREVTGLGLAIDCADCSFGEQFILSPSEEDGGGFGIQMEQGDGLPPVIVSATLHGATMITKEE